MKEAVCSVCSVCVANVYATHYIYVDTVHLMYISLEVGSCSSPHCFGVILMSLDCKCLQGRSANQHMTCRHHVSIYRITRYCLLCGNCLGV